MLHRNLGANGGGILRQLWTGDLSVSEMKRAQNRKHIPRSCQLTVSVQHLAVSQRNVLRDSLHLILKKWAEKNAVSTSFAVSVRLDSLRIVCRGIWKNVDGTRAQGPVCRAATRGREIPPQI